MPADEILGQLGQQLPGRRLIGPVRPVEKTDSHAGMAGCLARSALYHSTVRVQTRPEIGGRRESEQVARARDIETSTRLTVRLRAVEHQPAA